jgi:hypothetical protein
MSVCMDYQEPEAYSTYRTYFQGGRPRDRHSTPQSTVQYTMLCATLLTGGQECTLVEHK